MRSRVSRHLGSMLEPPARALAAEAVAAPPPEFNWRDYTGLLLHVASEIEHSLMVQYLYAAYSLGGPQVPAAHRPAVRAWQETILGVAKEEMGHLVTVQNLHTALGLPLNLDREDYPWGSAFYPFEFTLERLSLPTLATYVCAESPEGWCGPEADEIRALAAGSAGAPVNRVGVLYDTISAILRDRERIGDTAFDAATVPRQASWDEWGRGYRAGARGESSNLLDVPAPELLILEISSRDSALEALAEIGEQGESPTPLDGTDPSDAGEDSHFIRFITIFRAVRALDPATRELVSRPLLANPTTETITEPAARDWAHLANLRYRMLLVNLAHAFELADENGAGARGALINRTFAEMYNLRAIAATLVDMPSGGAGDERAGPPFQMPYTLALPRRERDRWVLHRDLLEASQLLIARLAPSRYLVALAESDQLALAQVERMLGAVPA